MKLQKLMVNGKFIKVNRKFIKSIGYFAFDGCHKFYMLEDENDIKEAMRCTYRLYPDLELKETYEKSTCMLKLIRNWKATKSYIEQFGNAVWSEVKATEKEKKNYTF